MEAGEDFRVGEVDRQGAGKIVLIVDDDANYCTAVGEILDDAGFVPLIAHSANQALLVLSDVTPDIILTDTMPLPEGASLLRIVRQVGRLQDIPVVAVSGRALAPDKAEALAAGANGFLAKPFAASQLLQEIRRHLANRTQQAA